MRSFAKKGISIFLLLTLLSTIPSCALANNQNMPPSPGPRESFDEMKIRMTESVNVTIENLESSKENFNNESTREASEKLIKDLKLIKEEISNAKTEDDLIKIRQELDTLFNEVPEEVKNNAGFFPPKMGSGPNMQNISENFSQDFKNSPKIMNNRSQPEDLNATMDGRPGSRPTRIEEKNNSANLAAEKGSEKGTDSGFLENLLGGLFNTLKSLLN